LSFFRQAGLHLSLTQSHTGVCSFTRSGVQSSLTKKILRKTFLPVFFSLSGFS
jgi:hypothetical protein